MNAVYFHSYFFLSNLRIHSHSFDIEPHAYYIAFILQSFYFCLEIIFKKKKIINYITIYYYYTHISTYGTRAHTYFAIYYS